jgi:hypothetical protein
MSADGENIYKVIELFNNVTRPMVQTPNWENIIKIVDLINANPHSGPDLIIPKMMEQVKEEKNPKIVWLSLIVIDSCVKNCCEEFIGKICNKEFMRRMKKLIYKRWVKKKRNGTPTANYKNLCGEKAAHMIQAWGIAFHSNKLRKRYPLFFNTYKHLVNDKSVRFPEQTKDETPVITSQEKQQKGGKSKSGGERLKQSIKNNSTINPKIQELVNNIKDNVSLLNEMLKADNRDTQTVDQIVTALKDNQEKLNSFINQNIDNQAVSTLLFNTLDDIEAALKKLNNNEKDDDSEKSKSDSQDSVTNTASVFAEYTQTDDTFLKMHIEPNQKMGNDFFIQDLVKSNNPFLDSSQPNTGSNNTFNLFNGSQNTGSFLGGGFNNSTNHQNNPPQNIMFNFSQNSQNIPSNNGYNNPINTHIDNTPNNFFNPPTTNNMYNHNQNPNGFNNSMGSNNTFNPPTNNNQFNPNLPLDLFGTSTTPKQNTSVNDPFENLFNSSKQTDNFTMNMNFQANTGNNNPFNNGGSTTTNVPQTKPQYNNPFL